MKTIKITHYPEGGHRTTEIFESEDVLIEEGYLHEMVENIDEFFDKIEQSDNPKVYGGKMKKDRAARYWVIKVYFNYGEFLAGLNSEVYVMTEGKTVASYKSIEIE